MESSKIYKRSYDDLLRICQSTGTDQSYINFKILDSISKGRIIESIDHITRERICQIKCNNPNGKYDEYYKYLNRILMLITLQEFTIDYTKLDMISGNMIKRCLHDTVCQRRKEIGRVIFKAI